MTFRHRLACLSMPIAFVCLVATAHADVKLASIFGDSMVLQSEMPVPVWGWAEPGEEVAVTLGDQTKKVEADKDGRWQVKLDALKTNVEGQTLSVTGNNTVELNDVLVGEVWICSGQSNMEWRLSQVLNAKEEVAAAKHPQIRLFDVQVRVELRGSHF